MRRGDAFTLIELLMVVLVVGVLASVAIPAYTAQKRGAQDAHAVTRLEAALRTVRAQRTVSDGQFPAAAGLAAAVEVDDPAVTAAAGSGFGAGVTVARVSADRVELRTRGADGTNFMIVDDHTAQGRQTSRLRGYRADGGGLGPVVNETENPGLESGAFGATWTRTRGAGMTTAVNSLVAGSGCRAGRYCGQVSSTGGDGTDLAYVAAYAIANPGPAGAAPVTPGQRVAVRCSVRVTAGTVGALQVRVSDMNAAGTLVASATPNLAEVASPTVGQWYDLGGVTTATSDFVAVRAVAINITGAATLQWDNCMTVVDPPGGQLPAYFDGQQGGGSWSAAPGSRSDGYHAERAGDGW